MMLDLQAQGCHNINFVSPSHVVAQILEATLIAARQGLRLPLVYNTGGYDSPEALALLDGVIDIYMPDMKYGDSAIARRYSHVRDYWEVNRAAVREMYRRSAICNWARMAWLTAAYWFGTWSCRTGWPGLKRFWRSLPGKFPRIPISI